MELIFSQGRDPNILLHNTQMQQLDQLCLEVGQEVSAFKVKELRHHQYHGGDC